MMLMQGQFRLVFAETSNVFPLVFLEYIGGEVIIPVSIIVDAEGNATLTGATLTIGNEGNAMLTGATLTVDASGNATVA